MEVREKMHAQVLPQVDKVTASPSSPFCTAARLGSPALIGIGADDVCGERLAAAFRPFLQHFTARLRRHPRIFDGSRLMGFGGSDAYATGRGGGGGLQMDVAELAERRKELFQRYLDASKSKKARRLPHPCRRAPRRGRRASRRGRRRSPANDSMAGGLLGSGAALAMWGLSQLRSTRGPRPNQPRPAPPRAAGARRTDAAGPTGCPAQRAVIPRIAHTSPARPQHRGPAPATPYPPHPPPTHPPKASLKPRPTP